jgi:AcrR family transcriptional regulator
MARARMAREDRRHQLVDLAWAIVREQGADALTLGHLAEAAEVTKPVVYDHFPSRSALLVALFEEYDARQSVALDTAVAAVPADSVDGCARALAVSHVECVTQHGRELAGVAAALEGSAEMADYKRRADRAYAERCQRLLAPHVAGGAISNAAIIAMLGAADAVSAAAADGSVDTADAYDELTAVVVSVVERARR